MKTRTATFSQSFPFPKCLTFAIAVLLYCTVQYDRWTGSRKPGSTEKIEDLLFADKEMRVGSGYWENEVHLYDKCNVIHIPCSLWSNRQTDSAQSGLSKNSSLMFLLHVSPSTRSSSRRHNKAHNYNKCCQRCACIQLQYSYNTVLLFTVTKNVYNISQLTNRFYSCEQHNVFCLPLPTNIMLTLC
jgi:hypothetical protein